jgi:hypothetical protein
LRKLRDDPRALAAVTAQPFWQKHVWLLDQLKLLQLPHGAGLEVRCTEHLLITSFDHQTRIVLKLHAHGVSRFLIAAAWHSVHFVV